VERGCPAIQYHQQIKSTAWDIREVRLQTFPSGYTVMGSNESRWKPETRESADHSLPFVMAMALMEGRLEIRHYNQEYYRKPEAREFMQKIKVSVGEESVKAWPEVPLNVVGIEMKTGEVHSTRVAYHRGHFNRLMSDEDQERKFRPLAERDARLLKAQVDRLLDGLRNLDEVQDIGEMLALTVAPQGMER
jgi:2-methylcitrate dehydratase